MIVGASMGGLRAAESLRRFGYLGPVVVIGDEPYAPYNRPPLSKEVLASDDVSHEAVAFPQRPATADVEWKLGQAAIGADLENSIVLLASGEKIDYSNLIIATGLSPNRRVYPNDIQAGRHVIRSLDDALGLKKSLKPGAKVVILGAGFVGCETAATARKLGCEVSIVAPGQAPIQRVLGELFGSEIRRRQEAQGVSFFMENTVEDLVGAERVEALLLGDGKVIECDVFIEAIGSHANTSWLSETDLVLDDGVLCDHSLRALKKTGNSWPNVFAIGDVAKFPNPLFDEVPRRIEHWNIPTECAKHVGLLIAAQLSDSPDLEELEKKEFSPVPSFWSDQFDMHILSFGLPSLADHAQLVAGDLAEDFVVEYHRNGELVGAAGIGLRSTVQGYRKVIERVQK